MGGVIKEMGSCEGWVVGYTLRRELQEGEIKVQLFGTQFSNFIAGNSHRRNLSQIGGKKFIEITLHIAHWCQQKVPRPQIT